MIPILYQYALICPYNLANAISSQYPSVEIPDRLPHAIHNQTPKQRKRVKIS